MNLVIDANISCGNAKSVVELQRKIPVIYDVDVIVAGGGPAGISAAISAARNGAKTLLIERCGYLGGMMTGSYVVWVYGMGDGKKQIVRGIAQEFNDRLAPLKGSTTFAKYGDYYVDAEMFKWLSIIMCEEAGARILLHSLVCSAITEDNCVKGIVIESKSGRQAVMGKIFIDATADGDLAHYAKARYENHTQYVTLIMSYGNVDDKKADKFKQENPSKFKELIKRGKEITGNIFLRFPNLYHFIPDIDITNVKDLSEVEMMLRKQAFAGLFFLRDNIPGYEEAQLKMTAPQIGIRESRCITGKYVLTEEDILGSRKFPDSIGRSGAHTGAYNSGYEPYDVTGIEYDFPYGCLIPEAIGSLLTAGRCISATRKANNTTRLIAHCMLTGQAAGTAAALAAARNIQPREMPATLLQGALKRQGVYLG